MGGILDISWPVVAFEPDVLSTHLWEEVVLKHLLSLLLLFP